MEYFEDNHGAIHDLAAHLQFQIARLRGRNLMIHKQNVDGFGRRIAIDIAANFFALTDTEIGECIEAGALLYKAFDNGKAQRFGQIAQFGQ